MMTDGGGLDNQILRFAFSISPGHSHVNILFFERITRLREGCAYILLLISFSPLIWIYALLDRTWIGSYVPARISVKIAFYQEIQILEDLVMIFKEFDFFFSTFFGNESNLLSWNLWILVKLEKYL